MLVLCVIMMLWCLVYRAQDQSAIQLSEMEEEMDHRIHTTERNTRLQVGKSALTVSQTRYNKALKIQLGSLSYVSVYVSATKHECSDWEKYNFVIETQALVL